MGYRWEDLQYFIFAKNNGNHDNDPIDSAHFYKAADILEKGSRILEALQSISRSLSAIASGVNPQALGLSEVSVDGTPLREVSCDTTVTNLFNAIAQNREHLSWLWSLASFVAENLGYTQEDGPDREHAITPAESGAFSLDWLQSLVTARTSELAEQINCVLGVLGYKIDRGDNPEDPWMISEIPDSPYLQQCNKAVAFSTAQDIVKSLSSVLGYDAILQDLNGTHSVSFSVSTTSTGLHRFLKDAFGTFLNQDGSPSDLATVLSNLGQTVGIYSERLQLLNGSANELHAEAERLVQSINNAYQNWQTYATAVVTREIEVEGVKQHFAEVAEDLHSYLNRLSEFRTTVSEGIVLTDSLAARAVELRNISSALQSSIDSLPRQVENVLVDQANRVNDNMDAHEKTSGPKNIVTGLITQGISSVVGKIVDTVSSPPVKEDVNPFLSKGGLL